MPVARPRLASAGRLFAALLAALLLTPGAWSQVTAELTPQARLRAAFDASELDRVAWSSDRDTPQFLAGRLAQLAPRRRPPSFVSARAALFGFAGDPELRVTRADTDDLGRTHVRMQQTVAGVPVWGAESALHLERDGTVYAWGGDLHPDAEAIDPTASLRRRHRRSPSRQSLGAVRSASPPGRRLRRHHRLDARRPSWWCCRLRGGYRTAFHVTLYVDAPVPANWEVFVDAQTGAVLDRFNSIHTTDARAADARTATASGWAGVPYAARPTAPRSRRCSQRQPRAPARACSAARSPLATLLSSGTYYLYDNTRGPQYIRTMTAGGGNSLPGSYVTDTDNNFPAGGRRRPLRRRLDVRLLQEHPRPEQLQRQQRHHHQHRQLRRRAGRRGLQQRVLERPADGLR